MSGYGILSSLAAGLRNGAHAIEVTSRNIANASTNGYKDVDVVFSELVNEKAAYANSSSNDGNGQSFLNLKGAIFNGSSVTNKHNPDKDGSIQQTNQSLDIANAGEGFFLVRDTFEAGGEIYLTDAGQFEPRALSGTGEAYLVNNSGDYVLGYPYDPITRTYNNTGNIEDLQPIPVHASAFDADRSAVATTFLDVLFAVSPLDDVGTVINQNVPIYDGSGNVDGINDERVVDIAFTKRSASQWDVSLSANNATITGGDFTIDFAANGTSLPPFNHDVTFEWNDTGLTRNVDIITSRILQVDEALSNITYDLDGHEPGNLREIRFNEQGAIGGDFDNGRFVPVAKIALGNVRNPNSLEHITGTAFKLTSASSEIALLEPGVDGEVNVIPFHVELSTAELSDEFINLINYQRFYNSISSAFNTNNQFYEIATNLKN